MQTRNAVMWEGVLSVPVEDIFMYSMMVSDRVSIKLSFNVLILMQDQYKLK